MTFDEIAKLSAKWYRIEPAEMYLNTRTTPSCYTRHLFCYIARKRYKYTLYEIARHFQSKGKKFDHSSVVHSVKVITEMLEVDKVVRGELTEILKQIEPEVGDVQPIEGKLFFPEYMNIRFKEHIEVTKERINEMRNSVPAFIEAVKKLLPEFYPEAELATFFHTEATTTKIKTLIQKEEKK